MASILELVHDKNVGRVSLKDVGGVAALAAEVTAAGLAVVMDRVAAALPTYLAAAGLLGTALAAWWWAERQLTP
jgi:hypothetical protein